MIGLDVLGIRLISPEEPPVLLLKEKDGTRSLPVWIGSAEAAAIAGALEDEEPIKPLTHDLLASVVGLVSDDGRVEITDILDGIYDATLYVGERAIEARVSDAVALALRLDWPILASQHLMDQVGVEVEAPQADEVEAFRAFLDSVNADDFEVE